jgi:hypothetical protein
MGVSDFGELDLYSGKTEDLPLTATLYASDGVTGAALAVADVVYGVLSEREDGEPRAAVLTVDSDEATENKSKVFITDLGTASPHTDVEGYVRLAQADLAAIVAAWDDEVASKRYVFELYYTDDSETEPADAKKIFLRGVIHLHRSGT